jgi:hypothetical protein
VNKTCLELKIDSLVSLGRALHNICSFDEYSGSSVNILVLRNSMTNCVSLPFSNLKYPSSKYCTTVCTKINRCSNMSMTKRMSLPNSNWWYCSMAWTSIKQLAPLQLRNLNMLFNYWTQCFIKTLFETMTNKGHQKWSYTWP